MFLGVFFTPGQSEFISVWKGRILSRSSVTASSVRVWVETTSADERQVNWLTVTCRGQHSRLLWALTPVWYRPPGPPATAGLWPIILRELRGDEVAEGSPQTRPPQPALENGPSSAAEREQNRHVLLIGVSVLAQQINWRPLWKSYCCHPELPVMFVIREHVSDLGQLLLQLSVRVDLNREAHQDIRRLQLHKGQKARSRTFAVRLI